MIVLYLMVLSLTIQRDVLYQKYIISPAFNWAIVLVFNQNVILKKNYYNKSHQIHKYYCFCCLLYGAVIYSDNNSWIRGLGLLERPMVLKIFRSDISYLKYENGRLTGLVTSYVETAF